MITTAGVVAGTARRKRALKGMARGLVLCLLLSCSALATASECVILLHGLARSERAMDKMADTLEESGYLVANIAYPSREHPIPVLAVMALEEGTAQCRASGSNRIHLVTHSLGGILVRQYLKDHEIPELGRVVMLAPPNQGSEVVDRLDELPVLEWIMGPAVLELGTGDGDLPNELGPVDFDLGIIAGSRSIDPFSSQFLPNPDDGKVSVDNTRVEGMCAMLVLPVSHALMMRNDDVIGQVGDYLKTGSFSAEGAKNGLCDERGR